MDFFFNSLRNSQVTFSRTNDIYYSIVDNPGIMMQDAEHPAFQLDELSVKGHCKWRNNVSYFTI